MIRDIFSDNVRKYLSEDSWLILQDEYKPEENLKYESLFCLSNGYMGTRGAYEEGTVKSIPCTYINGVFDKSETFMRELANLPNWLGIRLYIEKELIGIENCKIEEFYRVLDIKNALLIKRLVLEDKKGRKTEIEGIRAVSRANVHRMGICLFIRPLNYTGIIEVENILDASVINFPDAPRFKVKHTKLRKNIQLDGEGVYVEVSTRDRKLLVGSGSKIKAYVNKKNVKKDVLKNRSFREFGETAIEFSDFKVEEGETVKLIKYVSTYTEREVEDEKIYSCVKKEIEDFLREGFEEELEKHIKVYEKMWEMADIEIEGDFELNRAVRFTIFHLMSSANENDDRVNVGAKLLSGEEYGGHAFWDTELFMLPFFACIFPETAKNLENYRYNLLEAARENAKKSGYKGARYPWESADDGTEQCPDWTIEPDGRCYRCHVAEYEQHVSSAVAYGIYLYIKMTDDEDFLRKKGIDILFETARFWTSRCEYNKSYGRYEITEVTGPDEWHEPVNNNLYTNYLAKWNIKYVLRLLNVWESEDKAFFESLRKRLNISDKELLKMGKVQEKLYLPGEGNGEIFEQFEGYFNLKEVTIENYDENDWPIKPEILKEVSVSETQIIKQADVVMLMHLLKDEFDMEVKRKNYSYYEKRTLHGSSLSPSIYAITGLHVGDRSKAYRYLKRAAFIDLYDLQKNTREGIHAANAGGVWQTLIFGFAGVDFLDDGTLGIKPTLPEHWEKLSFKLIFRGSKIEISIEKNHKITLRLVEGKALKIKINEELFELKKYLVYLGDGQ